MCSVVGCDSWRRSAPRFKLPIDPENRLDWVRFLAQVNGQGFRESSWTDITICREHFTGGCFENTDETHRLTPGSDRVRLKPGAVPSLCLKSEPDEDERSPSREPAECTATLKHDDSPTHNSEESPTSVAAAGSPEPSAADTSEDSSCDYGQMLKNIQNIDIIREKAERLNMKGKYVVNEKQLLKLFSCKCPSCGSKVKLEKFTRGILVVLNQRCLQCDFTNQWRSQVKTSVPTEELSGGEDVTPQEVSTDRSGDTGVPEIFAIVDEQSDGMDDSESSDPGDMGSDDEEWTPVEEAAAQNLLQSSSDDEESEYEYEDDCVGAKNSQLCTECGMFFNKRKPHTCVHKVKPYSCNICGKRCVSELALNAHARVHDDNYEHRCKFCHIKFHRKVDKIAHEQVHLSQEKPYKCHDCPETFATNKECRLHLKSHRGPKQLRCDLCGIQFNRIRSLRRHLLVHTGDKPHKCSVCGRGFNQASHLKSHIRMHTGEKPYKCRRCEKCFNHNVSLKNHVQRCHADDDDDPETPEKKRNITRTIGRPKRNAEGVVQTVDDGKSEKSEAKRRKTKKSHSDEESEEEQSDSEVSCDSTVDKEELKTKSYGVRNTGRTTWKRRWKVKE